MLTIHTRTRGLPGSGLGLAMEPLEDGYLYRNTVGGDKLPNGAEDYAALRPLVFLNPPNRGNQAHTTFPGI